MKRSQFVPKKSNDVNQLQNFLTIFGYLNPLENQYEGVVLPPEPEEDLTAPYKDVTLKKKGKMDKPTVEALKNYQTFHGLKCTGKLDKATLSSMGEKRCGCPDIGEFTAEGRKWTKNDLTYGFQNYSPDMSRGQVNEAVAQAFGLWAAETPLSFKKVNFSSNPDIRIRFVSGSHGDGAPFDGKSGVLAHAFYPPPNSGALAGDAHFDEAESWTISIPVPSQKIDLVTVAAHEFGHSLGLRHSNISGSLMFPSYSGAHRYLHSDDNTGIRSIYGSYHVAQAPWIHGTSIQVEYPERLESIRRAGFYSYITGKANTSNWFHFAIPTPVIVDKKRLRIVCAILRFRTLSNNAIVKHVHIYDGYTKIASHNNVNLTGGQWFKKFGVAHKPHVYWGLGISLGIKFKSGSASQRRIDLVSAGVDLIE